MAKNKTTQIENERRAVNRISVGVARDFRATIYTKELKISCDVEDFHFQGVKLNFEKGDLNTIEKVEKLELCYGEQTVSTFENPTIIRHVKGSHLTLNLANPPRGERLRVKERMDVKPTFKPIIMAADPVKLETILNFEVKNLSAEGLLLETSLSNKHLLKGMQINQAQLLLPGVRLVPLSFRIQHLGVRDSRLIIGVHINKVTENDLEAIAQFALFGTLPPAGPEIDEKFKSIKSSVGGVRHLKSSIRCDVVSSPQEYISVLRIRYAAYKKAGKIDDNFTLESMADDYDKRAVVLAARIDGAIVGTVRLIESSNLEEKFPFEDYFKYETVLKQPRQKIFEVSRLAIDPNFQGTDIVIRLFKEVARINGMNEKTPVCLSTKALRRHYLRMGFSVISREVPHPLLPDESLALMMVNFIEFLKGTKMSATAWELISREVAENLLFAKMTKVAPNKSGLWIRKHIEQYILKLAKFGRKKSF